MIKYSYKWKLEIHKKVKEIFWSEWSEDLYADKFELQNKLDKEILEGERDKSFRFDVPIAYEIKEVEVNNLEIEGIVDDYGSYEDYTVTVGETRILELIIDKFRGQRIKIYIEIIE